MIVAIAIVAGGMLSADWQARAAKYLDDRSQQWLLSPPQIANFNCALACHTTGSALASGSLLGPSAAVQAVRARVIERVDFKPSFERATPFFGQGDKPIVRKSLATEAVMNAAALALDDAAAKRPASPETLRALDVMWRMQSPDGGWDWMTFDLEPWEASADTGLAYAALAAGVESGESAERHKPQRAALFQRLRARLGDQKEPMRVPDVLVALWASERLPGLLDIPLARAALGRIVPTQRADGGFALAGWGHGKLAQADAPSDGYATALAAVALCKSDKAGVQLASRAIEWLRGHQRADGSWPARSVNKEEELNDGYMIDAATAFAVLALESCKS